MQTIYLDVLFCVNFIIDYIILVTVKAFLNHGCKRRRLLLGAVVGGVCSFVILLPPVPSGISMVVSLLTAVLVSASAFCPVSTKQFIKLTAAFFMISFGYCGLMIAVWIMFSPGNLVIRNSSVYIDISPFVLILTTVFCYVILRVLLRIISIRKNISPGCHVSLEIFGRTIECSGMIDTGSSLKEPFSGEPAVVFRRELLGDLQDRLFSGDKLLNSGIRLIPFNSVGGEGVLRAVRPNRIRITIGKESYIVSAYNAFCDDNRVTGTDALVPYELIP